MSYEYDPRDLGKKLIESSVPALQDVLRNNCEEILFDFSSAESEKQNISEHCSQDVDIWKILPGGITTKDDLVIEFGKL